MNGEKFVYETTTWGGLEIDYVRPRKSERKNFVARVALFFAELLPTLDVRIETDVTSCTSGHPVLLAGLLAKRDNEKSTRLVAPLHPQ